jgi:hypothetical protein
MCRRHIGCPSLVGCGPRVRNEALGAHLLRHRLPICIQIRRASDRVAEKGGGGKLTQRRKWRNGEGPRDGPDAHARIFTAGEERCTVVSETQDGDLAVVCIPGVVHDAGGDLIFGIPHDIVQY